MKHGLLPRTRLNIPSKSSFVDFSDGFQNVSKMSRILLLCKFQSIEIGETSMTNMVSPQRSMNVLDSSRVRS